jgi:hypothetical protein
MGMRGTVGAAGAALLVAAAPAVAVTTVGSLSNFDAVNDTGTATLGFEIELDGLTSADVVYAFGGSYSRYGDPVRVPTPGGVIVRWAASWDAGAGRFTTATPVAAAGFSPAGHDCYNGGPVGNYLASGCEHFGVSLQRSQGNTTYRWLMADPLAPGQLIGGSNVRIPAPVFSVVPAPAPGQAPIVQAVIPAPVPENEVPEPGRFSDAVWMKRIKTHVESEREIRLEDLVNRNDAGALFDLEVETEYEWYLLQSRGGVADSGEHAMEIRPAGPAKNVAIRYEFHEFAGTYDVESHEAWCRDGPDCENLGVGGANMTDADVAPYRGAYLGAQMAAVNLVPEPGTWALFALGAMALACRLRRARPA